MAWRTSSESICMSGLHFTLAARLSRLPVAAVGTLAAASLFPVPQPASARTAAAPVTAIIGRVNLICSSGSLLLALGPVPFDTDVTADALKNTAVCRARVCEGAPVNQDWEDRVTAAWATLDDYPDERAGDFRAVIGALAAEVP